MMMFKSMLAIALGGLMLVMAPEGSIAADNATPSKSVRGKRQPLEVNIYPPRRRGGYSFGVPDVVNTYSRTPPPYADVRQTPGGPFDSGFFFDSAMSPRGGNSPYLH
jgi:hypothetical protein